MRPTFLIVLVLLAGCRSAAPRASAPAPAPLAAPSSGVIGVVEEQLSAAYWVRRAGDARRVVLPADAIARQNRALLDRDSTVFDLERLPTRLPGDRVRGWVARLSRVPTRRLYDERGDSVSAAEVAALVAAVQPDAVPAEVAPRFGLVTRRADLRTFPTVRRVFSTRGGTDIDRWQESALFPGTPVAIVHESRDGRWWFVVSPTYAAWIPKTHVAPGHRVVVLGYAASEPYLVVTGARVRTVFTPEQPAVSDVELDMGVRLPLAQATPQTVNGQNAYAAHVVLLPARGNGDSLALIPTLVPRSADVSVGYPALTVEGLLRQSFKFLGERYGWGHSYNGRDCSGFVGEVYRSFGVELPRNTGDQATSPALNRMVFTSADSHAARLAALRQTHVGDMIHIPGHTMMIIGHLDGEPYIIHDVTGVSYRGADGAVVRVPLNGVSVTPLVTLVSGPDATWVDRVTAIVRVRNERSAASLRGSAPRRRRWWPTMTR